MKQQIKVTKEFNAAFLEVVTYMKLDSDDIEECREEVRANLAWAMEFYPKAAAQIREQA